MTFGDRLIDRGRQEGRIEGKLEGKLEVAERLLAKGAEPAFVAIITDLSLTEIKSLETTDSEN